LTAILKAAENGHLEIVTTLLHAGADINKTNEVS
jgi:ankyrin repeat protein